MSVFATAIDALFDDPNLARVAVYRAGGADPGVPVRALAGAVWNVVELP